MLIAIAAMAFIAVICRWVFSPTHTAVRREPPGEADYGLLVPVMTAPTDLDARMLRDLLVAQGVRASLGRDHEVLVFRRDLARARELVGSR